MLIEGCFKFLTGFIDFDYLVLLRPSWYYLRASLRESLRYTCCDSFAKIRARPTVSAPNFCDYNPIT